MAQQRPLWLAFLDIEGAHDNIDRELLWEILEEVGVNEEVVKLLRQIYKDSQVQVNVGRQDKQAASSFPYRPETRLPFVPIAVHAICSRDGKTTIEGRKIGFALSHRRCGQVVEQRIPGLKYADDIVLLADNGVDLQSLADI